MKKLILLFSLVLPSMVNAQDVIVKKDGSTILAKVTRVTTDVVKYKDFSDQSGSLKSINIRDLLVINYEDGERDTFSSVYEANVTKETKTEAVKNEVPKPLPSDDELLKIYKGLKKKSGYDAESAKCFVNENEIVLGKGFEIPLEINDHQTGRRKKVDFKVSENIIVNGITIIPVGSRVVAEFDKPKVFAWARSSAFVIKINKMEMPNGSTLNISDAEIKACSADDILTPQEIIKFCHSKKCDPNIRLYAKLTNDLKIPLK